MTLEDLSDSAHDELERARLLGVDRDRVLWSNTSPPNWSDEQHAIASTHRALSRYVQHLRAHTDEFGERWTEDLAGGHEFDDGSTLAVSLDEIDAWSNAKYQNVLSRRSTTKEVHLSVAYIRELLRQADAVAREQGFIEPDDQAEPAEK